MKIIICTSFWNEAVDIDVANLPQVVNYFEEVLPEVYAKLQEAECSWVLADSSEVLEPVNLTPYIANSEFEGYDLLIIGEPIEGEALFSTIAGVIAGTVFGTTLAAATTAVAVASYALAAVIVFGAMFALKSLMSMMSPTDSFRGDGATQRKNLMLNGIPNIDEQGGPIPVIVGECFFGAVKAGQNITTKDISVSGNDADLDKTIPEIAANTIKDRGNGHWFRVA